MSNKKVGWLAPSRSKHASLMGRLLLYALSHWRRTVAILGAAAVTPMYTVVIIQSDWYLAARFIVLGTYTYGCHSSTDIPCSLKYCCMATRSLHGLVGVSKTKKAKSTSVKPSS